MSVLYPAAFDTDALRAKMAALTAHLLADNAKFNLTAITDPDEIESKHILDSLICAAAVRELMPAGGHPRLLDVGSGAGFPALPIAAALPDLAVTAIDATAKKVAHMNDAARTAALSNFSAAAGRAEDLARTPALRGKYDFVTARAVANLPVLAELCLPFTRVGGVFVAMKGKTAPDELAAAAEAIRILGGKHESTREYSVPGDQSPRFLLIIRKISPTPAIYPRNYSQITKKPL